jgi:hypothetical protein
MAKKLPIVPVAIGLGAGVATYFAATQLSQRVAFMQQHPMAAPVTLAAIGVLVAKKHVPIGIGIAGAAGAIGYLQYKAGTTTTPVAGTTPTQTATQPQPASQTTPASTTPSGTSTDPAQTALNQATQQPSQTDQSGQGSTDGSQPADGSGTGTAGYSAGKLLSGPHMHSHLANWRRGGAGALMGSGKLLSGPRPHSHLAPWHRNAGHYDAPAPGEAGGLRGGAFGLTSD